MSSTPKPILLVLSVAAIIVIGGGCGSHEERAPAPAPPPTGSQPSEGDTPATAPADPAAPPAAAGDIPRNCAFRVGERCFTNADEACTAAGCPRDQCAIMESYPAQVHCQQRGP